MRWFYNLRTLWKLVLGFSGVCTILAVVGYVGVTKMSTLNDMLTTMYTRDLKGLSHIKEAKAQLLSTGRAVRNVLIEKDPAEKNRHNANIDTRIECCRKELEAAAATVVTAEAKALLTSVEEGLNQYRVEAHKTAKLALEDKGAEALQALKVGREVTDKVEEQLSRLATMKEDLADQADRESDETYAASRLLVVSMMAGGILLGLVVGVLIARMIAGSLGNAVRVLENMAQGDFTKRLEVDTKDEIGQMARALNKAIEAIRTALQETRDVADGLASASQQLSAGSEEIASGAQEQASSLEETASSLEEITSTVKQTADNAQQANQLAAGARSVAEKGGRVVEDAIRGMGEINTASKKIADIITAIDEIAFQTNLLALNAAVEAARAGEQGRGFAVVAGEVRNLAQRSAAAAKEIKGLIQDSVRKVENGSELVNQSGKSLEEIVTSVKRVTDIVSEIAAASREQSSGIDQVNKAVTQMDQVTQANASQTEELSSTAESLAAQAETLQALVARFKLEEGSQRPAATPSAPVHATAAKKATVKKPSKPSRAKSPLQPVHEVSTAKQESMRELELVEVGASSNGHDGFEEF